MQQKYVRDSIVNGSQSPNIGVTGFGFSIFNKLIGVLLLLPIIFGQLPGVRSEVVTGPDTYNLVKGERLDLLVSFADEKC